MSSFTTKIGLLAFVSSVLAVPHNRHHHYPRHGQPSGYPVGTGAPYGMNTTGPYAPAGTGPSGYVGTSSSTTTLDLTETLVKTVYMTPVPASGTVGAQAVSSGAGDVCGPQTITVTATPVTVTVTPGVASSAVVVPASSVAAIVESGSSASFAQHGYTKASSVVSAAAYTPLAYSHYTQSAKKSSGVVPVASSSVVVVPTSSVVPVASSSAAVVPSSVVVPASSSVVPSSSAVVVVPSSSAVAPSSSAVAPSSSAVAPSSSAVVPVAYSSAVVVSSAAPVSSKAAYTSAAASATPSSSTSSEGSHSGKRGLAYNTVSLTDCFESNEVIGWAYNWAQTAPGLSSSFEYVPMLQDTRFFTTWETNWKAAQAAGTKHFFSFNEPDLPAQANMSPETAAGYHKTYMNPVHAAGGLVGAPSVTNGAAADGYGLGWLKSWTDACDGGCEFDFVNIHWYDSATNIAYFKKHINDAHTQTGKPVWVTEFGATGSTEDITAFLAEVLPWLDNQDFVGGYAYFDVDTVLVSGETPSTIGTAYVS